MAFLWSMLFVVVRAYLLVPLWASGSPYVAVFAASESIALASTVWSLWRGKVDRSLVGLICPLCYTVPLLLSFEGVDCDHSFARAYLASAVCIVALRLWLAQRCTVGVPCFSSLVDSGPYAVVRHPLAAFECLSVALVSMAYASAWNFFISAMCLVAYVLAVKIEEAFLFQQPEYRAYAGRVGWRMFPGIW